MRYQIVTYMNSVISVVDEQGPEHEWVMAVIGEQGHWEPTGTTGPWEIADTLDHAQIVRLIEYAQAKGRSHFSLEALP